jgi:purine-binding chemotaxis protein CheW
MEEKLVLFELGGETYGVDVTQVQSIIPMQEIITVPGAPTFVEGVVNLRGTVVPVVDLRSRFALSRPSNMRKSVIVIAELAEMQIGLVVDKVTEVTKISEAAIEPPSPLLTSVDTAYLRGIGKVAEEQLVILLDLVRVFSQDEQQTITQAV